MTYNDDGVYDTAYTYGIERVGIDILDGTRPDAQNPLYYLYDGQGSVSYITKPDGEIRDTYQYNEFGKPKTGKLSPDGDKILHTSFGYTGEQWDEEAKLQYLRARYYDPEVGRFINKDTYEGEVENPLSKNLYGYVQNNPVNKIDPTGHKMEPGSSEWFKHVKNDWTKQQIKNLQIFLNNKGYRDNNGNRLKVDGVYGKKTLEAHMKYFNRKTSKSGAKTKTKSKPKSKSKIVHIFNPDSSINTTACHIAATHNIPMNRVTINKNNTAYKAGCIILGAGICGVGAAGTYASVSQIISAMSVNWLTATFAAGRLSEHFQRHVIKAAEWGSQIINESQYLNRARQLLNSPVGGSIEGFISPSGYTLRYNVATNEFASGTPNGIIQTIFRPKEGLEYWLEQVEKYGGK